MSQVQQTLAYDVKWKHVDDGFRRFTVSGPNIIESIKQKICAVDSDFFANYKIAWEDEECDKILIESNDDFILGLKVTNKSIFRIFTVPMKNVAQQPAAEQAPTEGEEHFGVVCDCCDSKIVGHRYKCIVCVDFDICAKCEKAGKHDMHPMLRIVSPASMVHCRPYMRCPRRCRRFDQQKTEPSAAEAATEAQKIVNKLQKIGSHVAYNFGSHLQQAFLNLGIDDSPVDTNPTMPETKEEPKTAPSVKEEPKAAPPVKEEPKTEPTALAPQQQISQVPLQPTIAPPVPTPNQAAQERPPTLYPQNLIDGFVVFNEADAMPLNATPTHPETYTMLLNMGYTDTPSLRALAETYPTDINAAIDIINNSM